ncbi:hypothetical protein BTN49_1091 [Candidatus Enterovibrio escicola]|uniref:Uncharacterized protein n=1 Tax=Candidatus Enterovibrio escicola TaxID=1927127 RepID=A0A2A5T4L9_9GAMM|nr:hypothetical protein BTN49_1091 [Candidatus Enterovibrio escacola]
MDAKSLKSVIVFQTSDTISIVFLLAENSTITCFNLFGLECLFLLLG